MVWVYDDPPFTKREEQAYNALRRKLKDKKFVDNLIKLISLYIYLKRTKPTTVSQIQESAYFDKEHTKPIFDKQTAKKLLVSLKQKGGESKYPFTDVAIKGLLRDVTPSFISSPVGSVFGAVTGTVNTLKNTVPFGDLASEAVHGATEVGVTTVNGIGEAVGGPVGALVVAPFTAVAAGLASALSTAEGDIGGAVAHLANWIPGLGIILNKGMVQTERIAKVLKNHDTISGYVPYMSEYHRSLEQSAGKRLSTIKHRHIKWLKTQRRRSATL